MSDIQDIFCINFAVYKTFLWMMQEIWPFTFAEYFDYHPITLQAHWNLSPQKANIVRIFADYFYNGGFAE